VDGQDRDDALVWRLAQLDAMIEEPTVDCYNEEEQVTGLFTMIENNLALPFETLVLGVTVTVSSLELTNSDEIVAICPARRIATIRRNRRSAAADSRARWRGVDRGIPSLARLAATRPGICNTSANRFA
jgi:hypothetical protein